MKRRKTFRRAPILAKQYLVNAIFTLIDEDNLKISVLADITNLTRQQLTNYRRGITKPTVASLCDIAEAAGLEIIVRRKK